MYRSLTALTLAMSLTGFAMANNPTAKETLPAKRATSAAPRIEMAILLDTSGSMEGLINQARAQLWNIVNEFATTERDGQTPEFVIALYEYGKQTLPAKEGFIRRILPLTDDLDLVSEKLFELTTNGGDEFCGHVIQRAVDELEWSTDENNLKCIFIAGNEPFTQGTVDYKEACRHAIERGITVNTIHCGSQSDGIAGKWNHGALLADGDYTSIDQNQKLAIKAPQDKKLHELSLKISETYVAYGTAESREKNKQRQVLQDSNAWNAGASSAASRAVCKVNSFYCPSDWDLVDGIAQKKISLAELADSRLPKIMRKMTLKQKKAYVRELAAKRAKLQAEVKELGKQREAYVSTATKKLAAEGNQLLEQAIVNTARGQAARKGFKSKQ